MNAPVYRHLDTPSTLLGLAFPFELLTVFAVFWGTARISAASCVVATVGVYLGVRVFNYGRASGHLQHWIVWHVRQRLAAGLLSAAARAHAPRFPFAPYLSRELAGKDVPGTR